VDATVLIGELAGVGSPARVHSPLVGADLLLSGVATVPLTPGYEHAVLVTDGAATVAGIELTPGALLYLGTGRSALSLAPQGEQARVCLLGGEPFTEELVMWWNFVGRTHEDIVAARDDWAAASDRYGAVRGYAGDRLPAPDLPLTRLKPRDRHGRSPS
jgi:redox-sensitive bicupin YhaK (pirin superfamily)